MSIRFLSAFFALLFGLTSLAQTSTSSAYVVMQGDTLYGSVRYLNTQKSRCLFTSKNGEESTFSTEEISAFLTDQGKVFRSEIIENEFVEALVLGKMNLYFHQDKFYAQKDDGEIHLLEQEDTQVVGTDTGTGYARQKDNRWKLKLNYLMSDCSQELQGRIKSAKLSHQSLTRLFLSYNRCMDAVYFEPTKANSKVSVKLGVISGISFQVIKTIEEDIPSSMGYINTDFSTATPMFGVTAAFIYPWLSSSLSNEISIIYSKSSFEEMPTETVLDGLRVHETHVGYQTVLIPISLKNTFEFSSFSLYLKAGALIGLNSGTELNRTSIIRSPNGSERTFAEGVIGLEIEKVQLGYLLGTGIQKDWKRLNWSLNIEYNSQSGFWKASTLGPPSSKISRLMLTFGIKKRLN